MEDKLKKPAKKSSDLSDIVLEKGTSNVDKTKKMLLFAATLILLFLVGLVAMKLFNKPKSYENNLAQVGEQTAQAIDDSADKLSKKVEDTNSLFQQEPIVDDGSETDLKFEEMVRKLKAQDSGTQEVSKPHETAVVKQPTKTATVQHTASTTPTVHETKAEDPFSKKAEEIAKAAAQARKEAAAKIREAQTHISSVTSPAVVHTAPAKPRKVIAPPREIVIDTRVSPAQKPLKLSTLKGYFIQVGATTASFPDRHFLQKVKNAGYDYVIHSTFVHGKKIKKILIGPFASQSAARRKLPGVKSRLNPGAYIYRIQ